MHGGLAVSGDVEVEHDEGCLLHPGALAVQPYTCALRTREDLSLTGHGSVTDGAGHKSHGVNLIYCRSLIHGTSLAADGAAGLKEAV